MCRPLALSFLLGAVLAIDAASAVAEPLWTEPHTRRPAANTPIGLQSFAKLARTLGPAVVNVLSLQSEEPHEPTPPAPDDHPRRHGRGQGAGFIIHKSGYILTNSHVVDAATDIRVRLSDERELPARLIGRDERTDIALLKVDSGADLPIAPLGNSDEVQIGEWVVAIGSPFGLDHSVTAGIVSAKGRHEVRPGGVPAGYYDFIQTDASINPGNSGGPLINTRGEVIGINTAVNAQAQGIGFAIPINMAKVIAPLLKQHGHAPRSWLGVYPQSLTQSLQKAFRLGDHRGALIADVVSESPAARADVRVGDVVVEFDGHAINRADDLTWLVSTTAAGRRIELKLVRAGVVARREVTLELAPEEAGKTAPPKLESERKSPLGMTVSEVTPALARELGNPSLRGVVVLSVEPESPAVDAGLERGDLILRVGEVAVAALDDYARAVRALAHGDMLRLLVRRDGKNSWYAFPKR